MKNILALLIASAITTQAQDRFVTLAVSSKNAETAKSFDINESEVATLVSCLPVNTTLANPQRSLRFKIGEDWFWVPLGAPLVTDPYPKQADSFGSTDRPLVIRGPATFELTGTAGVVTFKITPNAYPVGRSLLLPPGPGAKVTLESSTNLVDWVSTNNTTHTNVTVPLFFRINMEKLVEEK